MQLILPTQQRLKLDYALASGTEIKRLYANWKTNKHKLSKALVRDFDQFVATHDKLGTLLSKNSVPSHLLDRYLDKVLSRIHRILHAVSELYSNAPASIQYTSTQVERQQASRQILNAVFPDDMRTLVHIPYEQEWSAVQQMLSKVQQDADLQKALKVLGLEAEWSVLQATHSEYGKALGITEDNAIQEVATTLNLWHEQVQWLLLTAFQEARETNNPELFSALQHPYATQRERQKRANA